MGRHEKAGWEFLVAQAHLERTTSYTETNTVLARRTGFRAFDFDLDSERNAMGELLEQLSLRSFNPTGNLLISVLVQFEQPLFEAAVAVAEVGVAGQPGRGGMPEELSHRRQHAVDPPLTPHISAGPARPASW